MADLFVDTSGWGNLVDITQPYHTSAASLYRLARQNKQQIITTNYIILELVALFTSPLRIPRPTMIAFVDGLKSSAYVNIIHLEATLDKQAWDLLRNRPDKTWSLVDCASFVVMTQYGLQAALTTDHHFEQAGFIRLLK